MDHKFNLRRDKWKSMFVFENFGFDIHIMFELNFAQFWSSILNLIYLCVLFC